MWDSIAFILECIVFLFTVEVACQIIIFCQLYSNVAFEGFAKIVCSEIRLIRFMSLLKKETDHNATRDSCMSVWYRLTNVSRGSLFGI